jgi:preprotein translocase subunit SecE
MARNRQRRAQGSRNPGPQPTEPHRENVPGELDHASGDAEEFEADLIAGADGAPDVDTSDTELERAATEEVGDLDDDGDVDADDRALARSGGRITAHESTKAHSGPRFIQFLRASWAELQRVQWPDRRQVGQATGVVIGFVIIAGAYLGIADWVAQKVVDLIL